MEVRKLPKKQRKTKKKMDETNSRSRCEKRKDNRGNEGTGTRREAVDEMGAGLGLLLRSLKR